MDEQGAVQTSAYGAGGTAAATAETASRTVDGARRPLADKLRGAAQSMRRRAERLADGGRVAGAVKGAAGKLESSADYLQTRDGRQMLQDFWGVIKRHPAKSLLLAGAVGFLIARSLRSD